MGAGRDAQLRVRFDYHTGLRRDAFDAAELTGSWDRRGRGSPDVRTTAPMRKTTDRTAAGGSPRRSNWAPGQDLLVIASLNNQPFDATSYQIQHPALADAGWREIFNSDAARYGGDNVGNLGAALRAAGGTLAAVVPANGLVILERAL